MAYLPEQVDDAEQLTSFVLEANKFRKDAAPNGGTRDVLHYKAFMPDRGGERSVFRMNGLDDAAVKELGRVFVALQRDKPLLGWGRIQTATVRERVPLETKSDEPPPRHAIITSWPADIEHRRTLAMELADKASATRL